ncbi:membrane-bound neuregulin protein vein isoform X2 [Rhynchophorus ferrugineus]|uniref:membrane-bound neuregulin protein vein isoform X2 n=1 Tax=Rhynchophorus ferrugineus TaxID=354439 RepID=UPI003FCD85FB
MRPLSGKCLYIFVLLALICTGLSTDEEMDVRSDDSRFPLSRRSGTRTRALRPTPITNHGRIVAQVFEGFPSEPVPALRRRPSRSLPPVCIREHYSSKAYQADLVVKAQVQGFQERDKKKKRSYKVQFKVVKIYKNRMSRFSESRKNILISFVNTTGNCVKDERRSRSRGKLVRADIKMSQEYILFLNTSSNDTLVATSVPELLIREKSRGMLRIMDKVCRTNFKPKSLTIIKLEEKSKKNNKKKLKIVCKVRGLPIFKISWKFNNDTISSGNKVGIRYSKTSSILVIRDPSEQNFGHYECTASSVNGAIVSKAINVYQQCSNQKKDFCLNGGRCFTDKHTIFCECADGFGGERCEAKNIVNPSASMYHQTPSYTCKLGLSTKYYC